jgi:exodeoxyribonuclease III
LRVLSWNVDGVESLLTGLSAVVDDLGRPDVFCVQELRIRAIDAAGAARLRDAMPGWSCGMSLASDMRNARFRGGRTYGVATFVRPGLHASFETFDWDREGRVVVAHVGSLAVFNVYAVNGTAKPYLDPETGASVGTRYGFKRLFQRRVANEIAAHRDRTIAIGDWNVSQTTLDTHPRLRIEEPHAVARSELAEILEEMDLVDVWRELHPNDRAYTWHNRRSRSLDAARVDFALLSRALLPRVSSANVLPLRGESDHAPIDVTLRD